MANLILYAPLALALALAFGARPGGCVAALLLSAALSAALETAQVFAPTRVPSLSDFALNTIGAAVGAALAPLLHVRAPLRVAAADHFALLLLACWLATRLFPFVPSLDIGEWRASLSPLRWEAFDVPRAARLAVLWWLAGRLLEAALPRGTALVPVMIVGTLAASVPIVDRAIAPADLAGGLAGLALWASLRRPAGDAVLLPATLAVVLAEGLSPFAFLDAPRGFGWVPFRAAFGGSVGVGMVAVATKFLLHGALLWLLLRLRVPFLVAAALVAGVALGMSVAQLWLPGRSAEITDMLIALTAAVLLWLMTAGHRPSSSTRGG